MTANRTITELYQALRPLLLRDVAIAASGSRASSGGMETHALNSNWHTGQLAETQAPWAATKNEWATALATHAALPDVHHAQVHALVGGDHTASGLTAGHVVRATGATAFAWGQLQHGDLGGVSANQHHNQVHSIVGGDHTISGSQFQVVGATGSNTLGLLTPAYEWGGAPTLLRSSAAGDLSLPTFTATTRVRAPLIDTASGNLTVQPAGDLVLDPVGNDVLPATNYDINLGMLSKKYLTLHAAELWVETLVAQNTIATIGGRILVGPTTTLTRDLAAGDTTIYVRHNQMVSGDRAYMEANGSVEFFAITSGPTTISGTEFSYTVTRNLDGSGANQWYAGDALFNTGQTGNGFIDLYSLRGVKTASQIGPTIVGNVRNSSTFNDWSEAWAIGNLNGLYGYGANLMGVGLGKYASGQPNIVIDPTNGVRLRQYNTDMIVLDPAGNSYFAGVMTIGTSGEIRQGTGTLGSNFTGLRLWRDSSIGRIGGYSANVLQWYGDTSGNFVAGAGDVRLNVAGVTQFSATSEYLTTEPLGGTWNTVAVGQRLSFYDKAAAYDWGTTDGGVGNYNYPGMEWLRLYVSSRHNVTPYPNNPFSFNYHAWDAVIEMPANTLPTGTGVLFRRRMILKAPSIYLDSSDATVQGSAIWHAGNDGSGSGLDADLLDGYQASAFALLSGAAFTGTLRKSTAQSGIAAGSYIGLETAGALATSTNNDNLFIFHLADNEMAIGVADSTAWRTLVLQPYGGTVDVRGVLYSSSVGYDWSELTPQNSWSNYGGTSATFGVKRFGNMVSVKGRIKATAAIAGDTAINVQLATEYRPSAARLFGCLCTVGGVVQSGRVIIDSSGYIRPQESFSTNDWLTVEMTYFTGG